MEKLPSAFLDQPSKMGWTLCPELNLKLNGSIWACAPRGEPSRRSRAAADPSQREWTDMATEPFRRGGRLRGYVRRLFVPGRSARFTALAESPRLPGRRYCCCC